MKKIKLVLTVILLLFTVTLVSLTSVCKMEVNNACDQVVMDLDGTHSESEKKKLDYSKLTKVIIEDENPEGYTLLSINPELYNCDSQFCNKIVTLKKVIIEDENPEGFTVLSTKQSEKVKINFI